MYKNDRRFLSMLGNPAIGRTWYTAEKHMRDAAERLYERGLVFRKCRYGRAQYRLSPEGRKVYAEMYSIEGTDDE